MTQSSASRPLSEVLETGQVWPVEQSLRLVYRLAFQVLAMHKGGRTHLAIDLGAVIVDEQLRPRLGDGPRKRRFGGADSDPQFCPPDLADGEALELPESIEAAAQLLAKRGHRLDPRRIDIYQLGTLICRLLTGEPIQAYLYRPKVKAAVPVLARPLLERALGHDRRNCFESCDQMLNAIRETLGSCGGELAASCRGPTPRRGSGATASDDTPQGRRGQSRWENARDPASDLPFQRLGGYQILARVGSGGMGDVYRGYDESLDRGVAIKVLPADLAQHEDFVQRFRAEAAAAARLAHPNVVPIFAIDEDAGHHFFVMQYVEGESLAARLDRQERLPLGESVALVEQCLAGLEAAHDAGLIHRDIKPANILLDRATGRALLADFGLVRRMGQSDRLTATGVIMGTVDYIAPEQARGHAVDGRADLYALGVLFYQLLSGRLPFEAETPTAMIFLHAYEEARPLVEIAPDLPPPILAVVARLMAKNPQDRYQTAREALADLEAFRQGRPLATIAAKPPPLPADRLEEDPALAERFDALAAQGFWQRARDWAATIFRRYAPEIVQRLQRTTQQIELAIGYYQRRCRRLEGLALDARQLLADLSLQLDSSRQAAARLARHPDTAAKGGSQEAILSQKRSLDEGIAALQAQLTAQRRQVEDLEFQLDKGRVHLARLRNQQDLLQARLRLAQTRIQIEGGRVSGRRLPAWRRALAGALLLVTSAVLGILLWNRSAPDRPRGEPPAAVAVVPAPAPAMPSAVANPPRSSSSVAGATSRPGRSPVRPTPHPRAPLPKAPWDPWAQPPSGHCLRFAGKHYVELGEVNGWDPRPSVWLWVRIAAGHGETRLFGNLDPTAPEEKRAGWALLWLPEASAPGGRLAIDYVTNEGKIARIASDPIGLEGQWHMLKTLSNRRGSVEVKCDGRLHFEGICRDARLRGEAPFYLGCAPSASQPFYGDIGAFELAILDTGPTCRLDFFHPRENAVIDATQRIIRKVVGAVWVPPVPSSTTTPASNEPHSLTFREIWFLDSEGLCDLDLTFSVEMWIKTRNGFSLGDSTWLLAVRDNPPAWPLLELWREKEGLARSESLKGLDHRWHHVALENLPGTAVAYLDGSPVSLEIASPGKERKPARSPGPSGLVVYGSDVQLHAFRVSSSLRYGGPFTPPKDFARDPQTLILLDFSQGQGRLVHDLSGHGHDGLGYGEWNKLTE